MNELGTLVRLHCCSQCSVGIKTADQRHRVLHLNYVWLRNCIFGEGQLKMCWSIPRSICQNAKRDAIWKRGRPLIHEAFSYNGSKFTIARGCHNTIEQ